MYTLRVLTFASKCRGKSIDRGRRADLDCLVDKGRNVEQEAVYLTFWVRGSSGSRARVPDYGAETWIVRVSRNTASSEPILVLSRRESGAGVPGFHGIFPETVDSCCPLERVHPEVVSRIDQGKKTILLVDRNETDLVYSHVLFVV